MLFIKSKQKYEELLPPPPPFQTLELEEEKPKVEGLKPTKKTLKKQKIPENRETKKSKKINIIEKVTKKPKSTKFPELEEDFGLEDIDFELQKEIQEPSKKDIEFPETLGEFHIEEIRKELNQETKPKEILEAEEEIKSAIEKIKKRERIPFFKRFFPRKEKEAEKPEEEQLALELPELDNNSVIQNKINETRQALMKFDLETSKKRYIELMKIYNKIKPEEQAKVYQDIRDIYFERKSAEELKV